MCLEKEGVAIFLTLMGGGVMQFYPLGIGGVQHFFSYSEALSATPPPPPLKFMNSPLVLVTSTYFVMQLCAHLNSSVSTACIQWHTADAGTLKVDLQHLLLSEVRSHGVMYFCCDSCRVSATTEALHVQGNSNLLTPLPSTKHL